MMSSDRTVQTSARLHLLQLDQAMVTHHAARSARARIWSVDPVHPAFHRRELKDTMHRLVASDERDGNVPVAARDICCDQDPKTARVEEGEPSEVDDDLGDLPVLGR